MKKIISAVIIIALLAGLATLTACNSISDSTTGGKKAGYQLDAPVSGETIAIIHTSMGDISIRLFPDEAPKTVQNFIDLAMAGRLESSIFHRVIQGFMIQGGDYENGNGTGGQAAAGGKFEDEFSENLFNFRGSVAMANSGKDTNGSQFFINQGGPDSFTGWDQLELQWKSVKPTVDKAKEDGTIDDLAKNNSNYISFYNTDKVTAKVKSLYTTHGGNPTLDGAFNELGRGHTVFGQVFEGMEVVDAIAAVELTSNEYGDQTKPVTDIIIKSIEIKEY